MQAKTAAAEKAARLFVPENEEEEVEVSPPAKLATEKAAAAEKAALGMVHRLEAPLAEVGGLEIRKTAGQCPASCSNKEIRIPVLTPQIVLGLQAEETLRDH